MVNKKYIFMLMLFFVMSSVNAATYYVATTGSDITGTGTSLNPWQTIYFGITRMTGGDTLIIKNGTYIGDNNRIRGIPSGSLGAYTTIKAEYDFGVILQGLSSGTSPNTEQAPINVVKKSYVAIEGLILKDVQGSNQYVLSGITIWDANHIKIRKVGVKNGIPPVGNYGGAISAFGCSYCLFEDIFATGMMRYGVSFEGGDSNHHNIMRRVVVRWDYATTDQPRASIVVYGGFIGTNTSSNILIQNSIVIDGNSGEGPTFTGGFSLPHETSDTHRYGSISLNNRGYGFHSAEDSLSHDNTNTHSILWDSDSGFWWRWVSSGMSGCYRCTSTRDISVSTGLAFTEAVDNVMVNGATISMGDEVGNINALSSDFSYITRSPVAGKGATIEKKMGVTGTLWGDPGYNILTTENLWPWSYESKIKELFSEPNDPPVGYGLSPAANNVLRGFAAPGNGLYGGPRTLTSYIWEYLGNPCPPEICNAVPSNCGNSIIDAGEDCDNGALNGVPCIPPYGSSCSYCSSICKTTNLTGAFCGDGTCNPEENSVSCPSDCLAVNVCTPSNVKCVDDSPGVYQEYSTIQSASNAAVPGDTILVLAGNYAGFQVTASGTSISPITFKANDSNVIINSDGPTGDGIRLQNVNYITLEGFDIRNPSQRCIAARGATSTSPMISNIIRKNKCSNSGIEGFYLSQLKQALVESNNITNAGNGIVGFSLHGIYLANAGSDDTILRDNIISGTGSEGMHFNGDILQGGDGIITGLLIERNRISGTADNGFSMDGVRDSMIRNNLVYNAGRSAARAYQIDAAQGPYNLSFVNNILLSGSAGWPIKITASAGKHKFFNNILLSPNGALIVDNIDFVSNYNAVSDGFSSNGEVSVVNLASWKAQGYDLNSFIAFASGLFVNPVSNDYNHLAASPAINAGISTLNGVLAPIIDLEGNVRPQSLGYDIGAYEFQGAVSSPATCQLTSALWSTTSATEGNLVSLNLQGTDCDGKTISFVVWEDDLIGDDPVITNPINAVFSGNTATGSWTAEWQDDALTDPEYYFIATLALNLTETITSTNQLIVSKGAVPSTCPDYALNGVKV